MFDSRVSVFRSTPLTNYLNRSLQILELDVTQPDSCFEVWKEAESIYGHVDVLCNNSGMSYMGALEDYTFVHELPQSMKCKS